MALCLRSRLPTMNKASRGGRRGRFVTRISFGQIGLACLILGIGPAFAAAQTPARAAAIDFSRDILPILSSKCFACHGPDRAAREAELRLDQRDTAIRAKAIVPGHADESALVQRIFSDKPKRVMPPPRS